MSAIDYKASYERWLSESSVDAETKAELLAIADNDEEIKHSWYVGFFPYEKPEYVICVMKENGISGSNDCAPVFKEVAEEIYILERIRK